MEGDRCGSPTLKALRHIVVWKKSSELCKVHHPGKPPCFFPSQFATAKKPQPLKLFPIFVQQCPSSNVYLEFTKQGRKNSQSPKKSIESKYYDKFSINRNSLRMSTKDINFRSASSHATLSSIYSSLELINSSRFTILSPITNLVHSPNLKPRLSHESLGEEENNHFVTSQAHPNKKSNASSDLDIGKIQWDLKDYDPIERFIEEMRAMAALVATEIQNWNTI